MGNASFIGTAERTSALVFAITAIFSGIQARGDTWASPEPSATRSSNQTVRAEVVPWEIARRNVEIPSWASEMWKHREALGTPLLRVSRKEADWVVLWQTPLSNEISPVSLLVADSGHYVVTFDNWHSVGYGSNVVVFYDNGRLLKKYSLEGLLDSQGVNLAALVDQPPAEEGHAVPLWGLFSHSVSSRWWQSDAIIQLDESTRPPAIGLFLPWVQKWMVFSLQDGSPIKLSTEVQLYWQERGRRWSLAALARCLESDGKGPSKVDKGDSDRLADGIRAMKFLALTRQKADRPLLEKAARLLEDKPSWRPRPHTVALQALEVFDGTRRRFQED